MSKDIVNKIKEIVRNSEQRDNMERATSQTDSLPIEKRIRWMCYYKNLNDAKYCKITYSRACKEDVGNVLISVMRRAHITEDIQRKIFEDIRKLSYERSEDYLFSIFYNNEVF